jgi:hypothetical protein
MAITFFYSNLIKIVQQLVGDMVVAVNESIVIANIIDD